MTTDPSPLALRLAEKERLQEAQAGQYRDVSEVLRRDSPMNAMTIDVEEHFQVSAFEKRIDKSEWGDQKSRVAANIDRILGLLEEVDANATFFTLGCVAERHPDMIRRIVEAGHEIASHGYEHTRVRDQSESEFRADVDRTKKLLEDIAGEEVIGYRAPSFSIGPATPWAHDILQSTGYRYSSSIYPIKHDHYGSPLAPRFPYRVRDEGLLEIPMSTVHALGRNWPCSGGGYFRLLPMLYSRWALRRINRQDKMPGVFYMHPWEIDADQPRIDGIPWKTRFRHYVNLHRFEGRLRTLLSEFRWGRADDVYRAVIAGR